MLDKIKGLLGKFMSEPEIDMEKSEANRQKMRSLFNQVVDGGDKYQLVYAYTAESKRFNYGLVHGDKTTYGSLLVGWNEETMSIAVVPTVPDLSGCGEAVICRYADIHKAYQSKYPSESFVIYPDKKGYINFQVADWLEDEKLFVYVSQDAEVKAFSDFFMNKFIKK